jgi:hypothetical protein
MSVMRLTQAGRFLGVMLTMLLVASVLVVEWISDPDPTAEATTEVSEVSEEG